MNESNIISVDDQGPVEIELLGDDELADISGGLTPFGAGAVLVGGVMGAALFGVAVGMAFYYFTRD